jgi:flagellar hook-associated protein 1 FlgK
MSLGAITGAAVSGLLTAQTALRTVSDNIANVDTPGYVRKVVDQTSGAASGVGTSGVSVQQVRLAADRFLQAASLKGAAGAGAADAASNLWDQAQQLFGDPAEDTSFFSTLDGVSTAFSTLASASPTSSAARAAALDKVGAFFASSENIANQLRALQNQADQKLTVDVGQVNDLLSQISDLNVQISRGQILGGDSTGPQNKQMQLIDQLSKLMDVTVTPRSQGGVTVRASDGMVLAGDGAASFSYNPNGARGELTVTSASGVTQLFGGRLTSGEMKGLLDMRNDELPAISSQLGELTSQTADQLNRIHNAYSSVPAPNSLKGVNTGLDLPTALQGFTGQTTVAIVDASGVIQDRVDIDFDAGTMSLDGGPPTSFTASSFLSDLNTALGAAGSASFSNGALSIAAANPANGVAIADPSGAPSQKVGRSFSDFFGLNDLVTSTGFARYDTGLTASDPHGFTAGSQITFAVIGPDGARLNNVTVTVPAAPTMQDLVNALNAPASGLGLYGAFTLDSTGELSFSSPPGSGISIYVAQDNTQRGAGGPSMSTLFGLDAQTRAGRAGSFDVRGDIAQDPSRLALARFDLTAAAGTSSLARGDIRGADALSQVGQANADFDPAGAAGRVTQTISDYSAGLAGQIARKAVAAEDAKTAAESMATEADNRRSAVEGVNLDQELISLTSYQQAYNASARMLQAAKDMYDTLLSLVQ